MKILNVLIVVMAIAGCVRTYDVTGDERYYLGYKPGQVYITKAELVLRQSDSKYLAVPGKSAPDIKSIQNNPGKWNDILGIVPIGTKFRIDKLVQKKSFEFNIVFVHARILEGAFKDQIVELGSVSDFDYERSPDKASVPIPDFHFISLTQ